MKQEYEDWIILYSYDQLNSLSDMVGSFCDEFNLKVKWSGMFETNATFSRTIKSLEQKGIIDYAFTIKVDRGWGGKGGNLVHYKLTSLGYELRHKLLKEEINK